MPDWHRAQIQSAATFSSSTSRVRYLRVPLSGRSREVRSIISRLENWESGQGDYFAARARQLSSPVRSYSHGYCVTIWEVRETRNEREATASKNSVSTI